MSDEQRAIGGSATGGNVEPDLLPYFEKVSPLAFKATLGDGRDLSPSDVEERDEWPLIERVRVLDFGPNDTAVLECTAYLDIDEIIRIHEIWTHAFPDAPPPIVLTGGLTIAAVLRGDA